MNKINQKTTMFNYKTDSWKVIESFITNNNYESLIRHHIESFNDFMDNKVEQIIKQLNPLSIYNGYNAETNTYDYEINIEFGDIYYSKPIINENDGSTKIMYPQEARLRNLTYSALISVDVVISIIKDPYNKKELISKKILNKVKIGKIPIMVRSKYCVLNDKISNNDECKYDLGGYWIINGNEKCIVSQEKIAENKVYTFPANKSNSKYSHICEIKSVSNNGFNTPKNVSLRLTDKIAYGNTIKVNIPHCRIDFPVFILFRAFGIMCDKEILEYIFYDIEKADDMRNLLIPSIEEGSIIHDQDEAIEYILTYGVILGQPKDIKLTKERKLLLFKEMMERDVLSHVGPNFKKKALFLGYMINKLLKSYLNKIKFDDRDSYCNKRIDSSGYCIAILFRQYFTKLVKDMRNAIMKELNSNPWKNSKAMNIDSIININNLYKIIKYTTIEAGLKYGLATGNWGIKSNSNKVGVAQVLSRLTYNSTLSHLRRVNTPTEKTGKLVPPRKLHNTQWGIICPSETPEGGSVGLVKNLAMMTHLSIFSSTEPIINILNSFNNIIKVDDLFNYRSLNKIYDYTKIFVNGDWVYITNDTEQLYELLIHNKRCGIINIYTSISLNREVNELQIFTDAGRCTRPLYIVKNNKLVITKEDITKLKTHYTYNNLLVKSLNNKNPLDISYENPIQEGCIEYVDVEESYNKMIAMNDEDLTKSINYDYCEIHASLVLGILSSSIPFCNHNQSPRNTYQSAMGKQAMGIYMLNYRNRMDTMAHILYYPNIPLVNTRIGTLLPSHNVPNGQNIIVAIASYTGYNQEDSIIINRGFIERGGMCSTFYRTYKDEEKKIQSSGQEERFVKPEPKTTKGMKPGCYDKLDSSGFVPVNTFVGSNDIIIGKILPMKNKNKNNIEFKDASTFLRSNETGYIDKTYINRNGDGHRFCKVKVRSPRIPKIGDKFSSRHGQKGTCGMILDEENMPFTKDGIRPDIIVNPHAIPSRMTIAQLIECLLGKICAIKGGYGDGTPFTGFSVEQISEILESCDFDCNGNEVLYDGFTGKQLTSKIFIGPTYYQRLKHMVEDKIHSRATGPMVLLTRQPAEGRARDGGLRFGEMERDCMIAHGSLQFLKERMMETSDNYRVYVCNSCGLFGIVNIEENIYKCNKCSNYINFSEVRIPYSSKLLIQELESMNIGTHFITN